ncbi:hypothetical protein ACG2F4_05105 [Halalkalibaculum sp. DA3122]|uniref:hypothetical protein n=1 Tax=Halalkalibaculum sp. DA3122 TaxID=3373607 RepID=UPI0037547C55
MDIYSEVREKIRQTVVDTLCGPLFGEDEILEKSPRDFYLTGIIYPQTTSEVDFEDLSSGNDDEQGGLEDEEEETKAQVKSNGNTGDTGIEEENDELVMTTDFKPSAFGISVMTELEAEFFLEASAGLYVESIIPERKEELNKKIENGSIKENFIPAEFKRYERNKVETDVLKVEVTEGEIRLFRANGELIGSDKKTLQVDLDDNLNLHVTRRDLSKRRIDKHILTFTLVNEYIADSKGDLYNPTQSYYQPEIKVFSSSPTFCSFDDYTDLSKIENQEELNLKLLYKNYQSYGTGHGASVTWDEPDQEVQKTKRVESQVIPLYEVKGNDFEPEELIKRDKEDNLIEDCEILYMKRLSGNDFHASYENSVPKEQLIAELKNFSSVYGDWIEGQKAIIEAQIDKLNIREEDKEKLVERGLKNLDTCDYLKSRMDRGIELLDDDNNPLVYQAFSEANKAMFMQRVMDTFIKQRKKKHGDKIFPEDSVNESLPNFKEDYPYKPADNEKLAKWRPFQLAFLLSQIEGIVNPESQDRDTVDLIWFTTGGGKTEAYLGLIAFTIFYRRLREGENTGNPNNGAGVTAIMRYTLRLLNKQQFNRAAPLICACELIRRDNLEKYGTEEISLGIWVGMSLTPNRWDQFVECMNKLRLNPDDKVDYSLPLFECPCCGTRMKPKDADGEWGIVGRPSRGNDFREPLYLYCPNLKCSFNISDSEKRDFGTVKEKCFPIYFVDEVVYKKRPTLLFATADKFASINWRSDTFNLFNLSTDGKKTVAKFPPPELIVQDELHLINSSLGTIYGVYEMAIDKFCSRNGIKPKVVSATATARNAEKQCKLIYGRENFLQFPPSGIDIDDSFFSRKITSDEELGRYYLGLQPSGFTNTVAQIRLVATLLQRISSMGFGNDIIDKYYTVLVYFNTLRELGKFRTLNEDDIVAYRNFLSKQFKSINTGYKEERTEELSSALDSDQINNALEKLEKATLPEDTDYPELKEFYQLGIRRINDIDILDKSGEWLERDYDRGRLKFKGEFTKLNKKDIFKRIGVEFNDDDKPEAIVENEDNFVSKAKEILPDTSWDVVQVASATSMISVGVDIPRLNVMQVTGQPRTHSEYIQASSRVGRRQPGIVITTYNPAKNRDRSHYERFKDYHQAFYKDVEPTTVTPYSLPALEKALPAVIYSLMQAYHFGGEVENARWSDEANTDFEEIRDYLLQRIVKTIQSVPDYGKEELVEIKQNVNSVCNQVKEKWIELSNRNKNIRFSEYADYPYYSSEDYKEEKVGRSVYVKSEYSDDFADKPGCMTSIRNVESGSEIKILKNS